MHEVSGLKWESPKPVTTSDRKHQSAPSQHGALSKSIAEWVGKRDSALTQHPISMGTTRHWPSMGTWYSIATRHECGGGEGTRVGRPNMMPKLPARMSQ